MTAPSSSKLDLLAELLDQQARLCPMGKVLEQLDDDDRAAIEKALEMRDPQGDFTIFGATISATLTKHDHPVHERAVQRHRQRKCCCSN